MIYGNPGDALRVSDGGSGERATGIARGAVSAQCPIAEVYPDDSPGHG